MKWNVGLPVNTINLGEVHVWSACIVDPKLDSSKMINLLSNDELKRANRFHFKRDQIKFINSRGILRKILSSYLNEKPNSIYFNYNTYGKPFLAPNPHRCSLNFNLSHSGEYALYAITMNQNVGIDLEYIKKEIDMEKITNSFFTKQENEFVLNAESVKRSELFYKIWTRKEAFIKAIGLGISFPLEKVDVSDIKSNELSKVEVPSEETKLYVKDIVFLDRYTAAIAVERSNCIFTYRKYH